MKTSSSDRRSSPSSQHREKRKFPDQRTRSPRRNGPRFGGRSNGPSRFRQDRDFQVLPPTPGELAHLHELAAKATADGVGFSKFTLSETLLGALVSEKFVEPTPIQGMVIPIALSGKDLLGCAQTGTGKTLAYSVPLLEKLAADKTETSKGLILVPTRELGEQIEAVLKTLMKKTGLGHPCLLIGGVSYVHQFRQLKQNPRVIVATPGRLNDHLQQGSVQLNQVNVLVLDEADRMLDVGFRPQLEDILEFLPATRQTLMLTATLSKGVQTLSQQYLKSPEKLNAGETTQANADIKQDMMAVDEKIKNDKVLDLLKESEGTALVFVKTQIKTERVAQKLSEFGVPCEAIHGGLSQGQRRRALSDFRQSRTRVLVATDVAARGLDIDHVNLVINYDLPQMLEDYVHRIGRTGRAGRKGRAVTFVLPSERRTWSLLVQKFKIPGFEVERSARQPGRPQGRPQGRGGFRGDKRSSGSGRSRPFRSREFGR